MFLKSLIINNGDSILQEIIFKKGLNLIIDDSTTTTLQESGNNVGKTTVLRLIDFCLGSNGKNVYQDPEFQNKSNTKIESFLKDNNIIISLTLKEDLDVKSSKEILIRRNFLKRSKKIQEIDEEYYNDKDFNRKLKELIFHSKSVKPTFREIISKNIRYENNRLENAIKVLHFSATFETYEALYLFWLGIDNDTSCKKQKLQSSLSNENSVLNKLKREGLSVSEIKQALTIINRDIIFLEMKKDDFNINESFEKDLDALNRTKSKLNSLSTHVNKLNMRKVLIKESKKELKKEYAQIDTEQLKSIYKSAESFLPNLHKKFTDMVAFHNEMLEEKIRFITAELPEIKKRLEKLNNDIARSIVLERSLSEKLKKSGAIEELEKIISELTAKFELKGRNEEKLRQWNSSMETIESIKKELEDINYKLDLLDTTLEDKIKSFNDFFTKISESLYGEQFILSKDKNDRAYVLKISTIGGNLGTGKKKGQIAAFDIAYIQFCVENNIRCLHFILHDQIESIHDNQLTLIRNVVMDNNIQFVVPILSDKLPKEIDPKLYEIITLSQDNKLFKVV